MCPRNCAEGACLTCLPWDTAGSTLLYGGVRERGIYGEYCIYGNLMINHDIWGVPIFQTKPFRRSNKKSLERNFEIITLVSVRSDVHSDPPASGVWDAGAFQLQALSS